MSVSAAATIALLSGKRAASTSAIASASRYASASVELAGTGGVSFEGSVADNRVRPITVNGVLTIGSGITIAGQGGLVGTETLSRVVNVVNRGSIVAESGTLSVVAASVRNEGILGAENGGTLSVTNFAPNSGVLAANTGGLITINGTFANNLDGRVNVSIGGASTSQFGRITVTGSATLDGTLNVSLANGFIPVLGNRFRFMTFASRSGFFATTNGLDIGGGLAFQLEQTDPLDLELVTVAAAPASATVLSAGLAPDGSLAYVQRSWVKDFVAGNVNVADASDEEELLIALPG